MSDFISEKEAKQEIKKADEKKDAVADKVFIPDNLRIVPTDSDKVLSFFFVWIVFIASFSFPEREITD